MNPGERVNIHKLLNGIWIPEAMLKYRDISPGAKLCYGRLCRYSGKNGEAYPSYKELASELGVKERMAKNYIKELKDVGLIEVVRTKTTNHYYTLWHHVLEDSLRGNNHRVQDNAPTECKIMHPQSAKECTSEESEKTPSDKAPEGINEPLRESLNENHQESGKRSHSLLQKFIVNHKQLTDTHYGFTPIVRDRDAKPIKDLLNNEDFNFTDDDVLLLQRLYFERPSPNEKENKNPIAWFPLAVNRLQGALAEYKAEIKRSENQAEQRRRDEEEYYKQQELDRREAERRAALTPEQRQLEDIHKKRKNIFMMLDARISCGRGYGDITERLKELDRAEAELLQVREAQVM